MRRLLLAAGVSAMALGSGCDDAVQAAKGAKRVARETKQKVEFYGIAQLLMTEHLETEGWPTAQEGLQKYIDAGTIPASMIEDPWGNRILYTPPTDREGRPELRCMGPDGAPNTADDIVYEWTN